MSFPRGLIDDFEHGNALLPRCRVHSAVNLCHQVSLAAVTLLTGLSWLKPSLDVDIQLWLYILLVPGIQHPLLMNVCSSSCCRIINKFYGVIGSQLNNKWAMQTMITSDFSMTLVDNVMSYNNSHSYPDMKG